MKLLKKILTLGGLLSKKKTVSKVSQKNGRKQSIKIKGEARKKASGNSAGKPESASCAPGSSRRRGAGMDSCVKKRALKSSGKRSSSRGKNDNCERASSEPVRPRKQKTVPNAAGMEALKEKIPEFCALGLNERVLSAVADMGYVSPTPIQKSAIPLILAGRDVIATAQTGTGKTAAFALPIIDKLECAQPDPRVLVLSPTRELASQTAEAFENFSKYTPLKTVLIQGGVSMQPQIGAILDGVDVVVATPGRLLDLIRQQVLDLKSIRHLVLDEVDRMFDMGFIEDVSNIIRRCPKDRQTLFFSATMPDAVMRLSKWALSNPELLETGIVHSPADTIEHFVYPVDGIQKYDLLIEILKSIKFDSLIVFTRTRIDADRISEWLLAHDYKVSTLHSDRTQRERDKALKDFKEKRTNILVATDIASRGLDISNVGYVINYNVPEHSEDYVHRIGRTGRANRDGTAITLFSSDETEFLKRIEAFINARIERRKLDGFAYRHEPVLVEEAKRHRRRNQ